MNEEDNEDPQPRLPPLCRPSTCFSIRSSFISVYPTLLFLIKSPTSSVHSDMLFGPHSTTNLFFSLHFTTRMMGRQRLSTILQSTLFTSILPKINRGTLICISFNITTIGQDSPPLVSHPSRFLFDFIPLRPHR
jgi:hypothetical protein